MVKTIKNQDRIKSPYSSWSKPFLAEAKPTATDGDRLFQKHLGALVILEAPDTMPTG
jgi:hypothetical protein